MRICCGTTTNKTPLLSSLITYMQVNPDWIVPQNIVKSDFLRHAGDSAYFARNRYYIVERSTGDTLTAANVTAEEMESGQLRIGQKGGCNNSLGHIVFRFTNDFGIYLHDTNNRRVFDNERRTLSHGCVRVEKPFELACFMLPEADEWLQDRLRISMNIAPVTDRGKEYLKEHDDDEKPLRLIGYQDITPSVPLYIIYYTAYPNPATNELQTWPDIYGYDKAIVKEMAPFLQKYE
jgi:murein L,D-transpeptidase YcbB/YkuD